MKKLLRCLYCCIIQYFDLQSLAYRIDMEFRFFNFIEFHFDKLNFDELNFGALSLAKF